MGKTLDKIAEDIKREDKRVQLIYAFNGGGKTRLSRELKELIDPKAIRLIAAENGEERPPIKFLYYNAYTEDLFYWDNDLDGDENRKLMIRPNGFTELAFNFLKDEGLDNNIATNFQRYTSRSITPEISADFSEIIFSMQRGGSDSESNIKISKGEESNYIWCVFYSLIDRIIDIKEEASSEEVVNEALRAEAAGETPIDYESGLKDRQLNDLEYIFIDDPVSSLDDNHLIELAVDIAELVKRSPTNWRYVITTHNPLFYNVLFNELNNDDPQYRYSRDQSCKKRLSKLDDGDYSLINSNDSPFSYHIFLLTELEKAIQSGSIEKYHFNFLRNILEKTSTFLGYRKWKKLLPDGEKKEYYNRIINLYSHSKHHGEDVPVVRAEDKDAIAELVEILKSVYNFRRN